MKKKEVKMGMLKAILVLIIGILLLLQTGGWITMLNPYYGWIIAILVIVVGIVMLMHKKQ